MLGIKNVQLKRNKLFLNYECVINVHKYICLSNPITAITYSTIKCISDKHALEMFLCA